MRRSLRAKVTLGVIVPLCIILGAFTAIERNRHEAAVFAQLSFLASQTGLVIEKSLQQSMLTHNPAALQQILDAVGENRALRSVYLLDISGRVVFAPAGETAGQSLNYLDQNCQPCHRLPPAQRPAGVVVTLPDGQRIFRSMTPIANRSECHACHASSQRLNGVLLTDISMASLEAPIAADLRENVLWGGGTILVTVIVVNLVMSWLVIRRLEGAAQTLRRFSGEHLNLRWLVDSPDEIGQLAAAFNEMGQRLQSEDAVNHGLSENLRQEAAQRFELLKRLITAQEEERRRVARDLHDGLGQELGGLALHLDAVEQLWDAQPERARSLLQQIRGWMTGMTDQAYDMILMLRPSALDDLGLAPALRIHAERALKETGIKFELETQGLTRRLPPEIETALFRTFQEALNNVVRHAGAKQVRVTLAWENGACEGQIADDGRGFDVRDIQANGPGPRGLGLLGMQERVAQCGGTLEIISSPGAGTRLRIRIPLSENGHGQ